MPKTASDELFVLIKSLTKNEKGYFKLYLSQKKGGSENAYAELFDLIDVLETYNEERITKKLKNKKGLSLLKLRLHEKVLKALESYHAESSLVSKVNSSLNQIEILFQKGLIEQCESLIGKTKKVALENEMFEELLSIAIWEKQILFSNIKKDNWIDNLKSFNREVELYLTKIRNIQDVNTLLGELTSFSGIDYTLRSQKGVDSIESILKSPILNNNELLLSNRAKRICLDTKVKANYFRQNFEEAYKYSLLQIDILPNTKNIQGLREYFNKLHSHAVICRKVNRLKETMNTIKKMRSMVSDFKISQNHFLYPRINLYTFDLELSILIDTCEFEKAVKLIDDSLAVFLEFEDKIMVGNRMVTYFNIAIAYFCIEDYKRSLQWINKCNDCAIKTGLRKDVLAVGHALSLILHFELKNEELIPYLSRSINRHLKNKGAFYDFEKSVIDFFNSKITSATSKSERKKLFTDLKNLWEKMKLDPLKKEIFAAFDFISWAESKISDKTFQEMMIKNAFTY